MNKVILMGRLTRDPDVRYSSDGKPNARLTLAVDRRFAKEGQQTADFIGCVAFGKVAEFVQKYLHQGTKITVAGRIQTGNYTGRDGKKVYTTDVVLDEIEFAESKNAGGQREASAPEASAQAAPGPAGQEGFMEVPDNLEDTGLPFA